VNLAGTASRRLQACKVELQGAPEPTLQVLAESQDVEGVALVPNTDISARLSASGTRTPV